MKSRSDPSDRDFAPYPANGTDPRWARKRGNRTSDPETLKGRQSGRHPRQGHDEPTGQPDGDIPRLRKEREETFRDRSSQNPPAGLTPATDTAPESHRSSLGSGPATSGIGAATSESGAGTSGTDGD